MEMGGSYLYRVSIVRRLASNAIDGLVVAIICFATLVYLFIHGWNGDKHKVFPVAAALMILASTGYAAFDLGMNGTAGKRIFGIRIIVNKQGSMRARLIRFLVKWIPVFAILFFIPLGFGMDEASDYRVWAWLDDLVFIALFFSAASILLNLILACLKQPLIHERISGASVEYWNKKGDQGLAEPRGFEVIMKKDGE